MADRDKLQWLLGIEYGNLPGTGEPIYYRSKGKLKEHKQLVARMNTGMSAVIPAWEILKAVHIKEFDMIRKKCDEEISQKKAESPVRLTGIGGKPKRKNRDVEIPPISRKEFFEKLTKATQRKD